MRRRWCDRVTGSAFPARVSTAKSSTPTRKPTAAVTSATWVASRLRISPGKAARIRSWSACRRWPPSPLSSRRKSSESSARYFCEILLDWSRRFSAVFEPPYEQELYPRVYVNRITRRHFHHRRSRRAGGPCAHPSPHQRANDRHNEQCATALSRRLPDGDGWGRKFKLSL